jgi:hypothetical protein
MKEITFVVHQMGTQGSYLNHLDLQQYLKDVEDYKIKFFCENVKRLFNVINDSRRNYTIGKGEVKALTKDILEPCVVITDFKSIIELKEKGTFLGCKKLIVLDSIELTYHLKEMKAARFYHEIDLYDCLKFVYTDEIEFLMPSSNLFLFKKRYPDLKAKRFYKKINPYMLDTLNFENRPGYFFRWDTDKSFIDNLKKKYGNNCYCYEPEWILTDGRNVPLKYTESKHIFDYQAFLYRRREYLSYQEQFGRLIFEYILLGKDVYFLDKPFQSDCLTDYLCHYGIEFDGFKVITTADELRPKMERYEDKPWETIKS